MVNVNINGTSYSIISEWKDFTIAESVDIYKVINTQMPDKLRDVYRCKSEEELEKIDLDTEDYVKLFPEFYGKVLCVLSDIPEEVMNKCLPGDRVAIYKQYAEHIVLGMMYLPQDIGMIDDFVFNEVKYCLPLSEDEPDNKKIGAYMEAIEFTEAADLERFARDLEGGKYERAADILAILCKPEGEEGYNEAKVKERAKAFTELPMDIAFGVFFSLINYMNIYLQDTVISLLPQESSLRKQLSKLISISSVGEVVSSSYVMETIQD